MNKNLSRLFLTMTLLTVILFPIGCRLISLGGNEDSIVTQPETSGSAHVNFKIVGTGDSFQHESTSDIPAGTIRANGTDVKVTFRLILVDPGASGNRVVTLLKTVSAPDGTAEASFQGVPPKTAIGEIIIEGGNISGKTHFHGAGDLTSGDNVLEVSPKGSGHRSDITATVISAITLTPELLSIHLTNLVSRIETAGAAILAMPTANSYLDVLNSFVNTQIVSDTIGRITLEDATGKIICTGSGNWNKTSAQIWDGTAESATGFKPYLVLRQGMGNYCYVSWKNDANTRFAVTKLKTSDGLLESSLVIEGLFRKSMVLGNGHLILGGTQNGLPLILRWNGTTSGTITSANAASFQSQWARQFPGLNADPAVPAAAVDYLEIEPGNTSILCFVRDPQTQATKPYRVSLDGATPEPLSENTGLSVWARPGNTENTIGWDSVDAENATYNLYWSLSNDLTTDNYNSKLTGVSAPYTHTALTNDMTYYYLVTWVDGGGTEHNVYQPASAKPQQPIIPQGFRKIAAGSGWSLLCKANGTIWSCGYNGKGPAGFGIATSTPALQLVQVARVTGIVDISTDRNDSSKQYGHTLFLHSDGTVWSVGSNDKGQLGIGNKTDSALPQQIPNLSDIISIAAGSGYSLAIQRDGSVWGWGTNAQKQSPGTDYPTKIDGLTDIIAVSAGKNHAMALRRDGTVWGWGNNYFGPLALEGGETYETPVQITALSNIIAISAGDGNSMFLKSDGTLWGAGYNNYGTMGVANAYRMELSQIQGITGKVTAVSLGSWGTLALTDDGSVWQGSGGSFTKVEGLPSAITSVSAGFIHYLAMGQDGTVWAWGYNAQGQLGNGTTVDQNTPVQMIYENPGVPGAPVNFTVTALTGRCILNWEATSATSYRIYWSENTPATKDSSFIDVTNPPFTHRNLSQGTAYHYAVSMINAGGESALSEAVQASPGPHRSIADGSWATASTWEQNILPTDEDDVIIEHLVTISGDRSARNVTIESSGTVCGNYGNLIALNKLTNKGTVYKEGGYPTFSTYIYGDFENNNSFWAENLFVQGDGVHTFTQGPDASSFTFPITVGSATASIKAASDLKFQSGRVNFSASDSATGTIDMNGNNLVISGGSDGTAAFRVENARVTNLGGFKCGDMNYAIIPYVENLSTPIIINGRLVITGTTIFAGDMNVESGGTLTNAYSAQADIRGSLTVKSGGGAVYTYSSYDSFLIKVTNALNLQGDFSPSFLHFSGNAEHTLTTASGLELSGTYDIVNAGASIKAFSDLTANTLTLNFNPDSVGILNMNGNKLTIKGGTGTPGIDAVTPCFKAVYGKVTNISELIAESMTYVSGTFENSSPIVVSGHLKINDSVTFNPGLTVNDGAEIESLYTTALNIPGSLVNNGSIYDNANLDGGLTVNLSGNLTQNGTYTPTKTVFTGSTVQSISLGTDKVLTGNWSCGGMPSGLTAATDIVFEQATLDLAPVGSPSGTLNMAGYDLNIKGGFHHVLGGEHGLWIDRGVVTGVSAINLPTAVDSQTSFGGTSFTANDSEIILTGNVQIASTTYMTGNVTLQAGSSLTNVVSQYLHNQAALHIDGDFFATGATVSFSDSDSSPKLAITADNYSLSKP